MINPAIIGSGPEPPASRPEAPLSRGEAEGKSDEFRTAMRPENDPPEDERAPAGRGASAREEKGETGPTPPPLSGDALLRGLGPSYAPLEAGAPALAREAPALAAELAERIMVNADNRAGDGEVRIVLKNSVLPDSEIILRQEGGRLVVQLMSGNPASLNVLGLAVGDLRKKLQPLDQDVSVEVLDSRNRGGGRNDGRSRGLDYFDGNEG